jgi:HPt (histidine-containing phosphotransfer) domain-containing protein
LPRTLRKRKIDSLPHRSNRVTTHLNASEPASSDPACRRPANPLPSGVLDLEELRRRCMGNIELLHRVLKMFEQQTPLDIETMEKALRLQDTEAIARVAHRLKGSAASLSADGMRQAAAEVEDNSRAGRVTELPTGIEHLHDEWEKYLDCAAALLSAANDT